MAIYETLQRFRNAIIAELSDDFGKINCFIAAEQKPVPQMYGKYIVLSPSGDVTNEEYGELKIANTYDVSFGLYYTCAIDELGKQERIVKELIESGEDIQKIINGYYLRTKYINPVRITTQVRIQSANDGGRWTYYLVQKYLVEEMPTEFTVYKSGTEQLDGSGYVITYDYLSGSAQSGQSGA